MNFEYFSSERFIHDNLIQVAEAGIKGLYKYWKKNHKIDPFIVTWPSKTLSDDNGQQINDVCVMELPKNDKGSWQKLMLDVVAKTHAYGILLVEQRDMDVRAIFETKHGSKCWTLPIIRSGDIPVLKKPESTINRENLGLLWRNNVGQA